MPSDPAVTAPFAAEAALTDAELDAVQGRMMARTRAFVPAPAAWRETLAGLAVALGGGVLAVLLGATTERDGFTVVMLLLAAYVAGLLAMRWAIGRHYRAVSAAQRRSTSFLQERRRYALGEDGIRVDGATADALWSWRALTEAEKAEGLLLFWVGHAHGFGIPARGFARPETAAAALAYARARIAAAHGAADHRRGPA